MIPPSGTSFIISTRELYLNSNRLRGIIPTEIGNLGSLTYLELSDNGLSGAIPTEIGNLTKLTYLYLATNRLSGIIPTEIGNLTKLTDLCDLSSNPDLCFPPDFGTISMCKTQPENSSIIPCPSLYSCINGNCTITTDTVLIIKTVVIYTLGKLARTVLPTCFKGQYLTFTDRAVNMHVIHFLRWYIVHEFTNNSCRMA